MSTAEDLIRTKTADFVGRTYIFDAVDRFLRSQDRGVVVIEGDPGAGKTAILARYVQRTRCIGHFNLHAQGLNTTRHFVHSLSRQMTQLYGTFSAATRNVGNADGETVEQIFEELRGRLPDELPLVIAVDALDEAAPDTGDANPLFLPTIVGKGVYLVVTTRREESAFRFDGPLEEISLRDYQAETMADVRQYLENRLEDAPIASRVDGSNVGRANFVERLGEMSEGNFMYLWYTLNDIASSTVLNLDRFLRELPCGLKNYYEKHWKLMGMTAERDPTVNAWILYVLCEAGTPLSAGMISFILKPVTTEATPAFVQSRLNQWQQFLHADRSESPARYSLYHASFRDFLHRQDIVANASIDLKNVSQVIADPLFEHMFGGNQH
ncbi:ATP-binding protein [Phytohabitans aurantiacus]|uniref:Orc1-like AAA ATPase domain-containing protein n=1 Tax=Phytohabitans aurantiacus TaxID=3016789 RepID=A0ABQ5R256_9ACTN|nr:ATP-binding protein [Phytohabitans aurantiacus]GLI00641.1 hypothetical protein Pa4123_59170 [Phytohabitans aurantiacus]